MKGIMTYPQVDNSVPVFSGELDDVLLEAKQVYNAGPGWNYQKFIQAFDYTPTVVAQVVNFEYNIYIKDVTARGFYYKIKDGSNEVADTKVPFHFQAIEFGGEI